LDGDPASRLAALDTERRALYASVADVSINTAGKSIQEVVRLVMNAVTAEHAS
jgi:shikimate kinase